MIYEEHDDDTNYYHDTIPGRHLHSGTHKMPKEYRRSQGPNNHLARVCISTRIGHGHEKKGGRGAWHCISGATLSYESHSEQMTGRMALRAAGRMLMACPMAGRTA